VSSTWELEFLWRRQQSKFQVGRYEAFDIADWNVDNYHGLIVRNLAREIEGQTKFSQTAALGVKIYPAHNAGLRLSARWTRAVFA
jgi:hypothetical protein